MAFDALVKDFVKNKRGKSLVWEYFGFSRTHNGTLNQKKVIVKCATLNYLTVETQRTCGHT